MEEAYNEPLNYSPDDICESFALCAALQAFPLRIRSRHAFAYDVLVHTRALIDTASFVSWT